MRIEQVVDEQVGGDRVRRAGEDGHGVRSLDPAFLGDVVDDVVVRLLDGEPVGAPDVADPDVAGGHRRDRVGRIGPDQRLLLLEQGEGLVELVVEGRVGRVPELDQGRARTPPASRRASRCAGPSAGPTAPSSWSGPRRSARVVADAGRPPHVRHGVGVARVVARVRPLGAEVDRCWAGATCPARRWRPCCDERRDVDRDREAEVVAAAVVPELGVGLLGVGEVAPGSPWCRTWPRTSSMTSSAR